MEIHHIVTNMKIIEVKKADSVNLAFMQAVDTWKLKVSDEAKSEAVTAFLIDICKKVNVRKDNNNDTSFTEQEVAVLTKWFKLNGWIIDVRDSELESRLKESLKLIGGPDMENLIKSVDYLSYNQQLNLAQHLYKIVS